MAQCHNAVLAIGLHRRTIMHPKGQVLVALVPLERQEILEPGVLEAVRSVLDVLEVVLGTFHAVGLWRLDGLFCRCGV